MARIEVSPAPVVTVQPIIPSVLEVGESAELSATTLDAAEMKARGFLQRVVANGEVAAAAQGSAQRSIGAAAFGFPSGRVAVGAHGRRLRISCWCHARAISFRADSRRE